MNDQVALIFTIFIWALIIAVLARSLFSWFPVDTRNNPLYQFLYTVTEPLLEPARRIIPRAGMFDLSAMAVLLVLYVMLTVIQVASEQ